MTTLALGVVAVILGIVFEKQNIAFMVSLAFAIAASANFPVLFLSVLWKGCTTNGAVIGGFLGLISSVGADGGVACGVGGGARQPEGLGAVPVRLPGPVLDDHRLRRHLAVLGARPQLAGGEGEGGLRCAAGALGDGVGAAGASGH